MRKPFIRRFVFGVFTLALGAGSAQAAPITLSAGDVVILNFDFPGTETFSHVSLTMNFAINTLGDGETDAGTFRRFTDLNATGILSGSGEWDVSGIITGGFDPFIPGIVDGEFSIQVTVIAGSVTLNPSAVGFRSDGTNTGLVLPTVSTPVPEPASLSMLGLGLAGLGVRRWRQRRVA